MDEYVKIMFGDVCFFQNPESLTVTRGLKTEKYTYYDGFSRLFVTDGEPCVIRGTGALLGEDASQQFEEMNEIFKARKIQPLLIFGCPPTNAVVSELRRISSPGDGFLQYEVVFTEIPEREVKTQLKCRNAAVIERGQSLWDISVERGIPIEKLMELNPKLSSPWDVSAGTEVRLK